MGFSVSKVPPNAQVLLASITLHITIPYTSTSSPTHFIYPHTPPFFLPFSQCTPPPPLLRPFPSLHRYSSPSPHSTFTLCPLLSIAAQKQLIQCHDIADPFSAGITHYTLIYSLFPTPYPPFHPYSTLSLHSIPTPYPPSSPSLLLIYIILISI